jgi:Chaperone for flagella basal body P-ring formation
MSSQIAATRRKNTAHGASRGFQVVNELAPKGRKTRNHADGSDRGALPWRFTTTLLQSALAIAVLSGTLLHGQDARPPRTPITRDEVWQAVTIELRQRGVQEEKLLRAEEIDLPALIPAAASRTLRVSMVCWDADLGRAQFQLECRELGHCIPFLAYAEAGRSTAMGSEIAGGSCRNGSPQRTSPSATRKAIVRSGDRATVLFRGSQLNLTSQVTCLERGAAGDVIRVRNQDGRIFRARISAPARLEALSQ